MIYGEKMKDVRTYNDIKQKEVAEVLGISPYTYSHYEKEQQVIPINHLINFCDYFKVAIDYIFGFSENDKINFKKVNAKEAGKRLKTFRVENDIAQKEMAFDLNTTQAVIANYERGRNFISTSFLYVLCKKYKVSADYILGRIDNYKSIK